MSKRWMLAVLLLPLAAGCGSPADPSSRGGTGVAAAGGTGGTAGSGGAGGAGGSGGVETGGTGAEGCTPDTCGNPECVLENRIGSDAYMEGDGGFDQESAIELADGRGLLAVTRAPTGSSTGDFVMLHELKARGAPGKTVRFDPPGGARGAHLAEMGSSVLMAVDTPPALLTMDETGFVPAPVKAWKPIKGGTQVSSLSALPGGSGAVIAMYDGAMRPEVQFLDASGVPTTPWYPDTDYAGNFFTVLGVEGGALVFYDDIGLGGLVVQHVSPDGTITRPALAAATQTFVFDVKLAADGTVLLGVRAINHLFLVHLSPDGKVMKTLGIQERVDTNGEFVRLARSGGSMWAAIVNAPSSSGVQILVYRLPDVPQLADQPKFTVIDSPGNAQDVPLLSVRFGDLLMVRGIAGYGPNAGVFTMLEPHCF